MDLVKKIKECVWLETFDDIMDDLKKLIAEAEKLPPPKEVKIYGAEVIIDGKVVDVIDDTRFIIRTDKEWIISNTEDPYNVFVGDTLEEAYMNMLRSSIRCLAKRVREVVENDARFGKYYLMRELMDKHDGLAEALETYRKAEGGKLKFNIG